MLETGKKFIYPTWMVEFLILLVSLAAFLFFFDRFYHFDFSNTDSDGVLIGSLSYKENAVRKKSKDSFFWFDIGKDAKIFDGDTIFSDTDSEAEVKFKNQTFLEIPSQSMVILNKIDGVIGVNVEHGAVDITLGKEINSAYIQNGKHKVLVKSTDGKVQVIPTKEGLTVKNKRGTIEVLDGGPGKFLKNGRQAKVVGGELLPATSLEPFSVQKAPPTKVNFIKSNVVDIGYREKPGSEYVIEMSKDPTFKSTSRVTPKKGRFSFPRPGIFYYRVVEKFQGQDTGVSRVMKTKVTVGNLANDAFPKQGQEVIIDRQGKLNFSWSGRKNIPYEIQIQKPTGETITKTINGLKVTLPFVRSQNLAWKIRPKGVGAKWSKPIRFNSKVEKFLKPEFPMPGQEVNSAFFPARINFKWNGLKKETYEMKIEKVLPEDETKVVWAGPVDGGLLKKKFKRSGKYRWSLYSKKFPEIKLENLDFMIMLPVASRLRPLKQTVVDIKELDDEIVRISWLLADNVKANQIEIHYSQDEDFGTYETIQPKSRKSVKVRFDNLGTWYWRIVPKDTVEGYSKSYTGRIKMDYPIEKITMDMPNEQIIRYSKTSKGAAYKINFPSVKYALKYELEIYDDPTMKNRVFANTVDKSTVLWVSKRDGQFFMRARVIDRWGRRGNWSRLGKLIFPISPLLEF